MREQVRTEKKRKRSVKEEKGELIQVLDPKGELVNPSLDPGLDKTLCLKMYRAMKRIRILDGRLIKLQRQGRIGFCATGMGQEACGVGSAAAYGPEDWVFPSYREHGIALWRGAPLDSLIAQFFGNSLDPVKGRQMPNHFSSAALNFFSISSPIATQIPHAVGVAMAAKIMKDPVVAVSYFGDGGTSENDFHVGLNFAAVYQAPVLFFCSNNQWAISVPVSKQTRSETLAIKAIAYGMPGVRVDGNDVLAVYAVTKEAVDRARKGGGPTLIEAYTYRLSSHSSSDDPTRYRDPADYEKWKQRDPLLRFATYLLQKGWWSEEEEGQLEQEIEGEISASIQRVEKSGPPKLRSLIEDVYAQIPAALSQDFAELERALEESGGAHGTSEAFPL